MLRVRASIQIFKLSCTLVLVNAESENPKRVFNATFFFIFDLYCLKISCSFENKQTEGKNCDRAELCFEINRDCRVH